MSAALAIDYFDVEACLPYNFVYRPGTADTTGAAYQNHQPITLWGPGNGHNNGLTGPPTGGNFVALDGSYETGSGNHPTGPDTSNYTTLTGLTPGQAIDVSFYIAGAQFNTVAGATTDTLMVGLGSSADAAAYQAAPTITNASQGFSPWEYETLSFTPTSTSEVLSFFNDGTPAGNPPTILLADVSVTSVPEPSSLLLFATGLTGLGGMVRARF